MIFSVLRKFDNPERRTWFVSITEDAVDWVNKHCPGSLVWNGIGQFDFNNKAAAIMFKIVWG